MQLEELVGASLSVGSTRKRKAKIEALAQVLSGLSVEEREIGARFLAGDVRQGRIGIGYATVGKTRDVPPSEAAQLSLLDVDGAIAGLLETTGPGSAKRRMEQLRGLLSRATVEEQDFLRRLFIGEVRQGALEGLLVEAVAAAAGVPSALVRRARMLSGDVGAVVLTALEEGEAGLEGYALTPFTPVHPMLAGTADGIEDALDKLTEAFVETKLDGARVQVHRVGDEVRVYSRRLNEVTAAVPEVVEVARRLPAQRLILDGETIALDGEGRPRPFQETMRRYGRRTDVAKMREALPLSTFFFDVLLLDDDDLLEAPAQTRLARLDALVPEAHRVPRIRTDVTEEADSFLADALAAGHEGVMAKSPGAGYEAGHRGKQWLKVKPVHTLDLVVIAAEWGSGRRKGWLSNLHLAARSEDGGLVMLGKTFKGMTDALLEWQTAALLERELRRDDYVVHVRPELVVEIAFDGFQRSPHYPGGWALRFARVVRYRPDKRLEEAATMGDVEGFADGKGGTA
ncbi:MAG: ATP-dependent DNA ligase [Myxococcota bacterium]